MPKLTGFASVAIRGPRAVPFVGPFANVLRFFGDPVGRALALQREFGDIAAVSDRSAALVCAFGAESNREVLSASAVYQHNTELLFDVPEDAAARRLLTSLILMNGDQHRRQRRLMTPAFSKAAVDGYRDDIVAVADTLLRGWPSGQTADVSDLLLELTACVAVRCLFGVELSEGALELGRLGVAQLDGVTSPLAMFFPFPVPGTPYHTFMKTSDALEARLRALVAARRAQPAGRDALSLMICAHDEDSAAFTDTELLGQCSLLFSAGHETTSNTLAWTLFLLAQHPRVLADLLDEIDEELHGDAPTAAQTADLKLLDRVIKESMRMLTATPVLFIRVLAREAQLGPYVLPEAANVVLSPLVTHRDPDRFPEPSRFRPERWEGLSPTLYEYLPFGAGPRMCLGTGFANLALRLLLPMILQRYRFTLAYGADISRKVRGITLEPKHGIPMLIAPQDRHFVRREGVRGDIHELVDLR
jgi:cytochrome P450